MHGGEGESLDVFIGILEVGICYQEQIASGPEQL
jgi:hypothetical protein